MSQTYNTSELAKANVLLDATRYAIATPKKRYQFSEFCTAHNFPTFSSGGRYNQEYKNLNGEWHILLKRYQNKATLCAFLEERIRFLSAADEERSKAHIQLNSDVVPTTDHIAISVAPVTTAVEKDQVDFRPTDFVKPEFNHTKISISSVIASVMCFSGLCLVRACFS
jgi:hypothetical protein